jgi:hypothetical protein
MKPMKKITKFLIHLTLIAAVLSSATLNISQFAVVGQPQLPTNTEPDNTQPGGPRFIQPPEDIDDPPPGRKTRVRGCNLDVTALMPENKIGRTVSDYPTFFFYLYLPKIQETEAETPMQLAEFILTDESGKLIYQQALTISNLSGVIGVSIPADKNVPPLEVGKKYTWTFTLLCDPKKEDSSGDKIESGVVRRVELSADILGELEKADPPQKTFIYAKNGIWQDALSTLAVARRANPNDPLLKSDWESLLDSVKLGQIAQEQILEIEPQP